MRYTLLLICWTVTHISFCQPAHYRSTNGISGKKNYNRRSDHPGFINIRAGLTQFFGELDSQDMHAVAGINAGWAFNKQLSIQADYNAGKVGGEKQDFFNSYFVNEFNTLECIVKWDLTEQFSDQEPGPVHFALYAGIGQIWFTANAFDIDNNKLLRFSNSKLSARNPLFLRWGRPKGRPGIKKTREGILPVGTSLDYALLKQLKIGLDYRFYFVRTDKMDATSGWRLTNPEESESYSDTPNDRFSFLSVFLSYRFGRSK
ncbi:hypothetical protein [Dyadobacter sp. MSC1_007]|jgi:hypothetical protein|uniref:hypothetical protein n=1 Tax=Dyadobacter sp. MSC1_007 TaxID=2909264 RepID=UPI00202DC03E|nr:hypothetical protein [Dyadobacter sp. MSC1_007]